MKSEGPFRLGYDEHLIIDDFLPAAAYSELLGFMKLHPLIHGWKNRSDSIRDFWHRNFVLPGNVNHYYTPGATHPDLNYSNFLKSAPPFFGETAKEIRRRFFNGAEFSRVWINVQTFGDEGDLHRDFPEEFKSTSLAAILYLQDKWDISWGGDLALFGDDREIQSSILVKPNRLVVFNGHRIHAVRPLSRFTAEPRRSLVFSCETVPGLN